MRFWRTQQVRRSKLARSLRIEGLEERRVFAGLPYGATEADLGEFLLGSVAVTPVFFESNGQLDTNTENWSSTHIQQVLSNINEGLDWWVDSLAAKSSIHELSFSVDTSYALTPAQTRYEPISRRSNDYALYVAEFLSSVGFSTGNLETDMRAFNQSQREKLGTDWSFSMFVVPSENDVDGQFASGSSFSRAFSFAGGLFMVVPSTRPASTFAHETGHMFWARDEYVGGGTYFSRRGYYNTQNLNSADNPTPGFVQEPSIMAAGTLLDTAYANHVSANSTLAMVGWQDSDGDGIFDLADVPHRLTGSGYFDANSGTYRFSGNAVVQTLPNLNSSGLKNDITINKIRRIEYRFDGGEWQVALQPDAYEADLNLNLTVPSGASEIEIRAVDNKTTVTSNVFSGRLSRADSTIVPGINGSVWVDTNGNGLRDIGEFGEAGWTVELVNAQGVRLQTGGVIEPDDYPNGVLANGFRTDLTLSAVGTDTDGRVGVFADSASSTGSKSFWVYSTGSQTYLNSWSSSTRRMRIDFSGGTSAVSIDAIGATGNSFGRLEAYNTAGQLLGRYSTEELTSGQVETMSIARGANDIAYVIVGGHMNSSVKLDNVKFGASPTTSTNDLGLFSFASLPAGSYNVRVVAPGYQIFTGATQTVVVSSNSATTDVDFGAAVAATPWRNPNLPEDVNGDSNVTPLDILLIINEINARGSRDLTGSNLSAPPFVDVSGDNVVSPLDILRIINRLNSQAGGEAEGDDDGLSAGVLSTPNHWTPVIESPGAWDSEEDELVDLLANERFCYPS